MNIMTLNTQRSGNSEARWCLATLLIVSTEYQRSKIAMGSPWSIFSSSGRSNCQILNNYSKVRSRNAFWKKTPPSLKLNNPYFRGCMNQEIVSLFCIAGSQPILLPSILLNINFYTLIPMENKCYVIWLS